MIRVHAGIDVGGTITKVILTDESFQLLATSSMKTPAMGGGDAILHAAWMLLSGLLKADVHELVSIGLGTAGVVDSSAGRILVVSDSFAGWAGYPIRDVLERKFKVPVSVENDVNAFLVGEMRAGAGIGSAYALGITLGTGVGGALWLNGQLYRGPGGAAGEIGHTPGYGTRPCTCGGRGHLETLASGRSISQLYKERTGRSVEASFLSAAASHGDDDAQHIFTSLGTALVQAVSVATSLLDIDTVVIGGGVSNGWDSFAPAIFDSLTLNPPVRGHSPLVVKASLGDYAVAIGCAVIGTGTEPLAGSGP